MGYGLFITGTGTDVGKTYVTALLAKKLKSYEFPVGYYKAALSGADSIAKSDAGYVNTVAGLGQAETTLLSYIYQNAVSPHLAAKWDNNPVELAKVTADYHVVAKAYDYVLVEGSGGIVCPLRFDSVKHLFLEDIIVALNLETLIVADAGLGTINATALTASYLKNRNLGATGVILNRYTGTAMEEDNAAMIEAVTGLAVVACVAPGDHEINIRKADLLRLFRGKSI
ncbi:MAG TPA: dethiobiotin synthase [Clostridiales bacterium]|nr:dethiobiotin synthase [Clostridiales bacterium]